MVTANLLGLLEGPELLIILGIVVLLFGGAKLPQLARSLGQAKKEFQAGMDAPAPAGGEKPSPAASPEMVSVSKDELDALRRAAERPPA